MALILFSPVWKCYFMHLLVLLNREQRISGTFAALAISLCYLVPHPALLTIHLGYPLPAAILSRCFLLMGNEMKDISSIWTGAWEVQLQLIALSQSLSFSNCWVQGLKVTVVLQGFVFAAVQACTSVFSRGKHTLTPWCGEKGVVQSLTWLLTTGLSLSSGVAVGWSICGLMHGTDWLTS